jgi:hypothetical protein
MVVHSCNPSYSGSGGSWFEASPGKKLGVVAHNCHPSYTGYINRRVRVQASLGIKQNSISKTTNAERAGGRAQVVERLHSKTKALSSAPLLQKKKNRITYKTYYRSF